MLRNGGRQSGVKLALGQRGEAAERRGDEHRVSRMVKGYVVDIEVAGGVGDLGHKEPVAPLVKLVRPEQVFKPPKLVARA